MGHTPDQACPEPAFLPALLEMVNDADQSQLRYPGTVILGRRTRDAGAPPGRHDFWIAAWRRQPRRTATTGPAQIRVPYPLIARVWLWLG